MLSFFHIILLLECDYFRNLFPWAYEEVEASQTVSVLVTRGLFLIALWGTMGLNKYLHHAHTCSNPSSRDAQGAQSSLEISPFLSCTANLYLSTDTDLAQVLQPGNPY